MMGSSLIACCEETDGLETPWIRRVQNRHAVAEHVADVKVTATHHDLHAVGFAADIAIRQVTDPPPNSPSRYRGILPQAGLKQVWRRCEPCHRLEVFSPVHR